MRAELTLPYPPSLWDLYVGHGKSKRRSPEYNTWLKLANLHHGFAPTFAERVQVTIVAPDSNNPLADIDNLCKAPLDFLVGAKILNGDNRRCIKRVILEWGDVDLSRLKVPSDKGVRVEIETVT